MKEVLLVLERTLRSIVGVKKKRKVGMVIAEAAQAESGSGCC